MNATTVSQPTHHFSEKPVRANFLAGLQCRDEAHWAMTRTNIVLSALRSRRISFSSIEALSYIYVRSGEPVSLGQLSKQLGLTTAAATQIADGIEKHGFAQRAPIPGDRRVVSMMLTPKGVAFAVWFTAAMAVDGTPLAEIANELENIGRGTLDSKGEV
ncbi:MAG: MarR family transcriptional regulator [Akkermansiaceae bacterium]|jgi:DNA-binding MarR family transcriptional regulator|nr:MarR family transcriptional regulator [Akkermansiaceae bacterium]MDP4646850.1 MarR family transcriptional regulator [Akkermansiaceae bacterium]MDP4780990.1 MarR family transcriptional regulator [Akkermansiaceae bacterium]MDP4846832.1 MarR family transcriptional regulator [Akkermansiaceae bacterium]MDP4897349.1 MarR family transcriptional regulator [Akkermansiaceae bacterium]